MCNDNHYANEVCRPCAGKGKVFFVPTLTVECKYCNGTGRVSLRDSGDELRYSKPCADNRHSDCEWDANDCDCAHHEERER